MFLGTATSRRPDVVGNGDSRSRKGKRCPDPDALHGTNRSRRALRDYSYPFPRPSSHSTHVYIFPYILYKFVHRFFHSNLTCEFVVGEAKASEPPPTEEFTASAAAEAEAPPATAEADEASDGGEGGFSCLLDGCDC